MSKPRRGHSPGGHYYKDASAPQEEEEAQEATFVGTLSSHAPIMHHQRVNILGSIGTHFEQHVTMVCCFHAIIGLIVAVTAGLLFYHFVHESGDTGRVSITSSLVNYDSLSKDQASVTVRYECGSDSSCSSLAAIADSSARQEEAKAAQEEAKVAQEQAKAAQEQAKAAQAQANASKEKIFYEFLEKKLSLILVFVLVFCAFGSCCLKVFFQD